MSDNNNVTELTQGQNGNEVNVSDASHTASGNSKVISSNGTVSEEGNKMKHVVVGETVVTETSVGRPYCVDMFILVRKTPNYPKKPGSSEELNYGNSAHMKCHTRFVDLRFTNLVHSTLYFVLCIT